MDEMAVFLFWVIAGLFVVGVVYPVTAIILFKFLSGGKMTVKQILDDIGW